MRIQPKPTAMTTIKFYIIKEDHLGNEYKSYITPEPQEYKVGLSASKWLKKGIVSMVNPLRDCTLYYEVV